MANPGQPIEQYIFGVFTVDTRSGELRKHGTRVKLYERPFQLLVALLERPGEVVTREELRRRMWPDGTFVDFDHNINSCVNKLRSALGDSPTHPRFIETVGSRGYRFLADIKQVAAPEDTQAARSAKPVPAASALFPYRRWLLLLGAAAVLVAAPAGYRRWTQSRARPPVADARVMLAVLPFENLTGDPGQDYFSDGLTEEMIADLGQLNPDRLGVAPRTSVMLYKHSTKTLDQIGRELGVQYFLEGSVRRDSGNVRITAKLIQVKDQKQLWARQYDRELKSLLIVQGEITQEIADEIQLRLGDHRVMVAKRPSAARPATSYEAYDLYLKGRYFWNKRTPPGFKQAAEYFQQAITKDPNYARAYAGLADTYGLMSTWFIAPHGEFMPKARAAALRALELDETLAEAHVSLALIAENYDYDWQTAEKEFRRAIQLNPEYATAHQWYAEYLAWRGRFDEALAESERSRQLDPMSLIIASDHGTILYYSRQYDRAIAQGRVVEAMDPGFVHAQGFVFESFTQQGRYAEALDEIERGHNPEDSPWTWAMRAYVYGRWGRQTQLRGALAEFERLAPRWPVKRTPLVLLAYVGTAHKDKVIALLQRAYIEHSPALTALKVDPSYDWLRGDPRFQDLLHRVGLGDEPGGDARFDFPHGQLRGATGVLGVGSGVLFSTTAGSFAIQPVRVISNSF